MPLLDNKANLGQIELNILASGDIEVIVRSVDPFLLENTLNTNEEYQQAYTVRKVLERFVEEGTKIDDALRDTIQNT